MENNKSDLKVLFIGKAEHHYSKAAADYIQLRFNNAVVVFSTRREPFPEYLHLWEGDLIISYLSQWIIPDKLLKNAKFASINLHPGPPEYPGIGCTNFAIYNGEREFGITCHHMAAKVDTGPIIAVRRFPVIESDTVYSLTQRCYKEILQLFYELINGILLDQAIPQSTETWKRKPYTRKQLNELCELTPDMSKDEISLRLKATTYGDETWAFMKSGEDITTYSSDKK